MIITVFKLIVYISMIYDDFSFILLP